MDAAPFAFAEVQVYGVWLCYVFIHQKKKAEKTSLILRASWFFFSIKRPKLYNMKHMWSLTHQPMFLFLEKTLEFVVLLLLK